MIAYHDEEWGVPVRDSRALWEKLVLDGYQAGLAWITVLRKREAFRQAFLGFDPEVIVKFSGSDVEEILSNPRIIRSRAKVESTLSNARAYLEMKANGEDFNEFVWSFTDGKTLLLPEGAPVPAQTGLSVKISSELKKRGFKFCGPVIVYAWMQAVGLVNDHSGDCFRRRELIGTSSVHPAS